MILPNLFILFIFFWTINSTPVSYQYVSFLSNGRTKITTPTRRSRSFGFTAKETFTENHFWNDDESHPQLNSLSFEEHRGHITPDFSNGLDYPDPFLLTGQAAKRAVRYLYRKPLFFEEVNHVDSLLRNQEQRRASGLAGNKLGSLRPTLPFYRFKKSFFDGSFF